MKHYLYFKKLFLFIALLTFIDGYSQYNELSAWIQNNASVNSKNKELTVEELKTAFNDYWKTHDKGEKGSGYKPFMRWENYWKDMTNDQGYIATPLDISYAWGQKKEAKLNKNSPSLKVLPVSNWKPVGPFTHTNTGSWSDGQGRVNVVYVDPSNENTVYVGTPAGGIWKSTDAGTNWKPLSDELPQIGVSGIAVDHTNPNTIYIATGDKDGGSTYSIGVLKSTDAGKTWAKTGLAFTNTSTSAGDLVMHPTNNQILWCATKVGIYKTTNAGTTWTNVQAGNFSKGNLRLKPNDPKIVYAVTNDKFYRSTDTGTTFTNIVDGLPGASGRLVLDITPANPAYIYILSTTSSGDFQGVYKSTNGGESWVKTAQTANILDSKQSSYDLAICASSTNAEEIYTGCLNIWKSVNGGTSFTKLNNWSSPSSSSYTHADIHFLRYFGNKFYCGSDGGVYVSSNNGVKFSSITAGLQISQFYKISVSKQSSGKMVGGLQDNGGHAYSNNLWKNYYGADGMDTAIDPTNSNKYYGFIQNGGSLYISNNAGDSNASSVGKPSAEDDGNWVTPLGINSKGELFAGYTKLYRLNGASWVAQSTNAIGSGNIDLIVIDPSDDKNMYVTNGTGLYKSIDKGVTFASVYTASGNISSVCVHSSNSNIIYITTSGISGQVLKSTNGGSAFTSFSNGLPSLSKNVVRHQGKNALNPLYIGTSLGVYYKDDSMSQWEAFDTNLPNVSVVDLEVNTEDNIITAATYGRGIWQSSIPTSTLSNPDFELKNIGIYPNPSDGIFNISTGESAIDSVIVYDVTGKIVESLKDFSAANSESSIDLRSVADGIYFVKISLENKSVVKQIIKNH
jgi:photosystem II stability/assembly factor-like uncharacterized protein